MAYDIGAKIGIDGEKEFNQALKTIDSQIKVLQSEMKASVTAMAGMDDAEASVTQQTNILGREIDATQQKISILSTQYDRAKERLSTLNTELQEAVQKFGENSVEASKAQNAYNRQAQTVNRLGTQLNNAQADLNKLNNELSELTTDSRKAADGVDDLGNALDDAGNSAGGLGSKISEAFTGGAVAGAVSSLVSGMQSLIDSTSEYTRVMGTLETSSQRAGYTAEETAQTYNQLYGVLGDTQTAATAAANLQALGLEQSELTKLTDYAIGAWATYGDSIPIDSLAESINETIRAGQVTGTFADALNWAGTSEDEFNEKLAAAGSESERVNLVMQELAKQGLGETAEAWRENNAELLASREATASLDEAMAELAQSVMPVVTKAIEGIASAIQFLINNGDTLIPVLTGIGAALATLKIVSLASSIASVVTQLGSLSAAIGSLVTAVGGPIAIVVAAIAGITTALITLWNTNENFRAAVITIWENIKGAFESAWQFIQTVWSAAVGFFTDIWAGIQSVFSVVSSVLGGFFTDAWSAIQTVWNMAVGFFQNIWNGITGVFSAVIGFFTTTFTSAYSAVTGAWESITSFFTGIWEDIKGVFDDVWDSFTSIGSDIVNGIKNGVSNAWNGLTSWVGEKVDGLIGGIKGILGIHSPSRVMATEVGLPIAQGIGVGIRNGEKGILNAADDVNNALLKQEKAFAKEYSNLDLTKDISARMTTSVQRLTVDDLNRATAAAVNGITTGSAVQTQSVIQIPIYLDSRQIAQATYDPLRGIARQRGETYG